MEEAPSPLIPCGIVERHLGQRADLAANIARAQNHLEPIRTHVLECREETPFRTSALTSFQTCLPSDDRTIRLLDGDFTPQCAVFVDRVPVANGWSARRLPECRCWP